jgi:hypothetical protein
MAAPLLQLQGSRGFASPPRSKQALLQTRSLRACIDGDDSAFPCQAVKQEWQYPRLHISQVQVFGPPPIAAEKEAAPALSDETSFPQEEQFINR